MIVEETLVALKDSKRVVELKFQTLLSEKARWAEAVESLSQEAELLQVKNQSLDERLVSLQRERDDQTEILAEIQQSLVQRTSSHEAEVRRMQEELDRRLDEIIATKLEDVESVKEHYIRLFNEKAAELMLVRHELEQRESELGSCQLRCRDLEYREQELSHLVNKMRENPEQIFGHEVKKKLEDYESNTRQLADRLRIIQAAFVSLKSQEEERIQIFARECEELRAQLTASTVQASSSVERTKEFPKETDFSPAAGEQEEVRVTANSEPHSESLKAGSSKSKRKKKRKSKL
jgi:chromosome segregation ATPase